jgi:hypothetical protein
MTSEFEPRATRVASNTMYVAAAASAASGGSAAATSTTVPTIPAELIFGLTANEWSVIGVIGGLVIALAGYLTNVYFKLRQEKAVLRKLDEVLSDE